MAKFLSRIGAASARHRILVLVLWGAALIAVATGTLTGLRFSDGGFDLSDTESGRALSTMQKEFPNTQTDDTKGTLQLVFLAPEGQKITSKANRELIAQARDTAGNIEHVASVSNPFSTQQPYVSSDGTTAVVTVSVSHLTDDNAEDIYDGVLAVSHQARTDGLGAEVGGSITSEVPEQSPAEGAGVIIAFIVLFFTFGSLLAAGANMLGAVLGLAVGLLGVFSFSAIHPIGSTTPTLAGMIGLAVGIDYGLFILARFRTELREGRSIDQAIARASGTAGSAVVFAGMTVVIALAGLSVVRISFITEMGLAAAVTVATSVLMALTLLPALMRSMGYRVMRRKERRRFLVQAANGPIPVPEQSQPEAQIPGRTRLTFLQHWIRIVVKAPLLIGGVAVLALLALSIPTFSLSTSLSTPGGDDPATTQRIAYDQISDKFGAGSQGALIVLAEGPQVTSRLPATTEMLSGLDDVASVTEAGVTKDDGTAMIQVVPASGPVDSSTRDLVENIRDHDGDVAGVDLSVTGSTAVDIDTNEKLAKALIIYLVLIVGLSLVLLIILFRSLLVPLLGTLGFLLSLGTGFGMTVGVFQWGWFDSLVPAPSGNPILSLLPILIVGILFGLAMDYQVFLVSRMHEAHRRGLRPLEAIIDGFDRTAVVIVAAALIMGSVFTGFALAVSPFVAAIGFALAIGIVTDALIVRMIIVPAALALFGEAAWWIPQWLDRILPNIDAEGQALEDSDSDSGVRPLEPIGR